MILTDNFRKERRRLQGGGVNLRQTIVTAGAFDVYEDATTIPVPALKAEDTLISVLDLTDLTDIGDDVVRALAAELTTSLTGANNDLVYTARKAGEAGNDIYVEYVDPGTADAVLSVAVSNEVILGALRALITVNLATDGSSVITSTAAEVRAAVLQQADAPGHPLAADLVDVENAPANDGSGVVTAMAASALTGGANDSQRNGTAATVTIFTLDKQIVWTARKPGAAGNNIDIEYVDPGTANAELSVEVTRDADGSVHIVVNLATDGSSVITTTAADAQDAVEDSAGTPGGPHGAADFVSASLGSGDGSTLLTATGPTALAGGSDDGSFKVTGNVSVDQIMVTWLTHKGF